MRAFRLENCCTLQSMIFIIGQLFVGLMVASGVVRIDLAFASPQADTNSPASDSDNRSIPEWFASANKMFMAGNFREARLLYEKVAARCKGTELCVQCEYFASISAWNLEQNEASAKLIEAWLLSAKSHEQRVKQNGSQVASPSWSHWIQSAQIVLSNWEASQNRLETAKNYLTQSLEESDRTGLDAPRIHYELGKLHAIQLKDPKTALTFLNKAIASTGSDNQLKTKVLLAKARVMIELDDPNSASECIQSISENNLSNEQRVIARILESRILKGKSDNSVSSTTFWEEALIASMQGKVEPEVLTELASSLRESGLLQQANQIYAELVRAFPNHSQSIQARVQLAYQAANQKDWQQVQELTLAAIELGAIDQWGTYALYLNGRAKIELGQKTEGISLLDSLLEEPTLSNELNLNIHLDLAQAHYLAEAWDKMSSHVESLTKANEQSALPKNITPRIRMWKAELLAHQGEWERAESIVSTIRNDFPEWNRRTEVDYLLARCLIARAEFDSARELLHAIVKPAESGIGTKPNQSSVLAARAAWMIGETYMMQQRYEEASQAYGEVLQFPNESFWCAASIVQKGLCAEQLNRFQEAKDHYEKVIAEHSESPFAQTARTRLSGISFSTKQVERIGSGTKR